MIKSRFIVCMSLALACSVFVPHHLLVNADEASQQQPPSPADEQPAEEIAIPSNVVSPSIDADVTFRFTKPLIVNNELPIGKEVHFLVGFKNKGEKDFTVNTLDASFRYAPDFSYSLQNFSTLTFNRVVPPQEESTLAYTFFISEAYAARSYGFTVNLLYSDKDGVQFQNAVFNETVSLIELDEGLDRETFFVYILLIVFVSSLIYAGYSLLQTYTGIGKRPTAQRATEEVVKDLLRSKEVDYDWLPSTVGLPKASKTAAGRSVQKPVAN